MMEIIGMDGTPIEGGYGIRAAILTDGHHRWCSDGRKVPEWPMEGCTVFPYPLVDVDIRDGVVVYHSIPAWGYDHEDRRWLAQPMYQYGSRDWARRKIESYVQWFMGTTLQEVRPEILVSAARKGLMGAIPMTPTWEHFYEVLERNDPNPDQVRRERGLFSGNGRPWSPR